MKGFSRKVFSKKVDIQAVLVLLVSMFALTAVHAAGHEMHGKGSAADEVEVVNPYARAVSAMQKNSAVFMSLKNHGHADHALVRASGKVANAVELHTHINDGGVMRMRPIEKITVPAGGQTMLKPGGHHVMLIGLTQTLEEGGMVHIELEFEDGSKKMLMAPVKSVMPMGQGSDMPMNSHKHNM